VEAAAFGKKEQQAMSITKADAAFLRRIAGPQHWTEEDARRVLTLREATGDSEAGFARRYGLRARRLGSWRRRLDESKADKAAGAPEHADVELGDRFVELVTRERTDTAVATVHVGDVVVELAAVDHAGALFIAALSRALGAAPCC